MQKCSSGPQRLRSVCRFAVTLAAVLSPMAAALSCGGGGGGITGPVNHLTVKIHFLDQNGNALAGLVLTYTDPGGAQHTVTADASGTSTLSLSEAGGYYLYALAYETYHYGPGSLYLGTVNQSDVMANRVVDYYAVYNLGTGVVTYIGPVAEDTGFVLASGMAVGTWYFTFQWNGRTQGALYLVNNADGTCLFPGGQPGDSPTDVTGHWYINGNGDELTWILSDGSIWIGGITGNTSVQGFMETPNNTGNFTGHM